MKRLSLAIAAICFAGASYADTTSFTDTDNAFADTNFAMSPLTLSMYNPALHGGQALTKATFRLTLEAVIKLTLSNVASTVQNTQAAGFVSMSFGAASSPLLAAAIAADPQFPLITGRSTVPLVLNPGDVVMAGSLNPVTDLLTTSDVLVFTTTDAAILAQLTGAGDIGLNCSTAVTGSQTNTGGNVGLVQQTQARCLGSVEYMHRDIETPEPTSLGLIGIGLASAGLLARRRRMV